MNGIKRIVIKKLKALDDEINKRIDCYFNKEISACYYIAEKDLEILEINPRKRSPICEEYLNKLIYEIEIKISNYLPEILEHLKLLHKNGKIIVNPIQLKTLLDREKEEISLDVPAIFVPYRNEIYINIPYEFCESYKTCKDRSIQEKLINFFMNFVFSPHRINEYFSRGIFHEIVHFFDEQKWGMYRDVEGVFISEIKASALTSSIFNSKDNEKIIIKTINDLETLLNEIEKNKVDIKYLNPYDKVLENVISTYKEDYIPRYGNDKEIEELIENIQFKLIPIRHRMIQSAKAKLYGNYIGVVIGSQYLSYMDESTKSRYLREFLFTKHLGELFSLMKKIANIKFNTDISLRVDEKNHEIKIFNNKTKRGLTISLDNILFS